MLDNKMQNELNKQLNREIYSAYLYLSMASCFDSMSLKGFSSWMKVQAQEEMSHAMKLYDYVIGDGSKAVMAPIDGPPTDWESPLTVFENVASHEAKVTGFINSLVKLAVELKDDSTNDFLQWFVKEQVEEEESAGEAVQKVKLAGEDKNSLLAVDKEFSARVFTPPAK